MPHLLSAGPEAGDEEDEEGEAFETAHEHEEGADEFASGGEAYITAKAARGA